MSPIALVLCAGEEVLFPDRSSVMPTAVEYLLAAARDACRCVAPKEAQSLRRLRDNVREGLAATPPARTRNPQVRAAAMHGSRRFLEFARGDGGLQNRWWELGKTLGRTA